MTNAELIATIRNEIERRIEAIAKAPSDNGVMDSINGARGHELMKLLSFLSTLESEKPMNQDEELNEEIKRFIEEYGYERGGDRLLIAIVARHFAQWGAEHLKK